ncbi:hypothetical protein [Streptomyces sp. cg2]|uniref:hypothetical protein n=1 Tax=Streptomyces sp. cg2 TaxID=3238799 RepID=UPI0034E2C4F1
MLFPLVSTRLHSNRKPKNIIFASQGKPDIRFRSSVDNGIEIVGGRPGATLVHDREIPVEGLRWRDLRSWWQDTHKFSSEGEAGEDLYQRLLRSLPGNSPGQRNLFAAYRTAHPFCADMVAADRELKLRGYEVFRFGHDELKRSEDAEKLLLQFLPDMFSRFKVKL